MNYGFVPTEGEGPRIHLAEGDEPDRLCIQLYRHVVNRAELSGKDVLEVGSGRGGGASYVARYHRPAQMIGVDFSSQAVALCKERHKGVLNLDFRVSDAETLPFSEATFDAVINVESSHCYGDVRAFVKGVHRVLRPGGWFLFADLRDRGGATELEEILTGYQWTHFEKEEITAGVVEAMERDDGRKRTIIEQLIPTQLRPLFEEFAGLTGGKVHRGFQTGELAYLRFGMQK
ncbi:MAG TPA: class I SAM-dependent methyltransferase [Chthoniobacteraceae bacterium]|nr:class I SAM-dependent methyltransferase [Chthoniobacteraceae bacterium]